MLWLSRVGNSKRKETEKINAAYWTNNAVCNRRCEACGRCLAGGGNLMGGRRLVKCCQLASFMTELEDGWGLKGHNQQQQQQEGVVIGIFKRIKIYLRFDIGPPEKAKRKAEQVCSILLLLEAVIQSKPDHIYNLKRGFGFSYLYENIVVVGRNYIRLYIQ